MATVIERLVVADATAAVLERIHDRACALALWTRAPAVALDDFEPDAVDDIAATIAIADAAQTEMAVRALIDAAGYDGITGAALAADVAMLCRRHGDLLGSTQVALRLEVVESDACRKFHADYVTLRMISTYMGRGTQWLAADDRDDAQAIREITPGTVAIFKGRRLLDDPPILHRSPPIAASGDKRLLLVVDPASSDD